MKGKPLSNFYITTTIALAMNTSNGSHAEVIFIAIVNSTILLFLFLVIALDILILSALLLDSGMDKVVRIAFSNILLASLIVCVLSVVARIISFWLTEGNVHLCKATSVLITAAGIGRLLFSLAYAVLVLLVIRHWDKPILARRNVKYFFVTAVVLWCVALVGALPLVLDDVNEICVPSEEISIGTYLYLVIRGVVFVTVPIITIAAVAASFYYTKRYTILKKRSSIKPIIRFAIFVILDQFFTLLGGAGAIVTFNRRLHFVSFYAYTACFAVAAISLIVCPILIIVLVGTTRKKICSWLCCNQMYTINFS